MMDDPAIRLFLPALGSLAAGFLGGAIAWFATNYWGKPVSQFLELRCGQEDQGQEAAHSCRYIRELSP
jgi:hypothetical protein